MDPQTVSAAPDRDPSAVMFQNAALQAPSHQGLLTTLDEDSSRVSTAISLTFPRELVEHILLLLDTGSVLTCKLVNREFNTVIQSSTLLQYSLACKAAGVIDNPRSPLSSAERLEALLKREDAWKNLKPVFETTIDQLSSTLWYGLGEGTFYFIDNNQNDLHYCHLPSSPHDNLRWIRISGQGPGERQPGIFLNLATALYEHDLIINVISSDIGNHTGIQLHSLDLVLLKFSTGEYHPLARQPRIHVQRSPSVRPSVTPRIVGDNLALIVHNEGGMFPDKLFIFDWKTGHKRLEHEATENAYPGLVFVSPELLLVPNLILSHFEVWHVHPPPNPPVQILSLKIPAVSDSYSPFSLSCRGMPNPFLHSVPYFPSRPFFPSPEDSIIIVNFRLQSFVDFREASYMLIMHRHALLDTIRKWTSPSLLEQQDLPVWLTNEVAVHKIADQDYGSVRLDAQSKLVSMTPRLGSSPRTCGSPTSSTSTSYISTDPCSSPISSGSSATLSTSRYDFLQVKWADWGPPISRWLTVNETQAGWIGNSSGQIYAFLIPNLRDTRKSMISVADFNPHNVRRNGVAQLQRGKGGDNSHDGNNANGKEEEEWEILNHEGVFSEDVYMGLKCMVYHAPDEYDCDLVFMDEERLLGLKLDRERRVESVKILYFG